jgi:hypothetical protein
MDFDYFGPEYSDNDHSVTVEHSRPMRFHLRVDDSDPAHITFTVFANGANCGQLVMSPAEYSAFGRGLLIGCLKIQSKTSIQVDTYVVDATMPAERTDRRQQGE